MKIETVQQAAFIECPDGVFYRVDYVDETENVIHFHNEHTGDEHTATLEEMEGWKAHKIVPVEGDE